jgi:hypothetical protein
MLLLEAMLTLSLMHPSPVFFDDDIEETEQVESGDRRLEETVAADEDFTQHRVESLETDMPCNCPE